MGSPFSGRVQPAAPTEQRNAVTAPSAQPPQTNCRSNDQVLTPPRIFRILVISDVFPDPEGGSCDLHLLHILRALRTPGGEVTFIAREAGNKNRGAALLDQAGIQTYEEDSERLPCLGGRAKVPSWSFCQLIQETAFDVALLVQSFRRSISIPEHYLDDLRQYSAGTRIAILPDRLHMSSAGNDDVTVFDYEKAENLASRQGEMFGRSDVVIVPDEESAARLHASGRNLQVEVIPSDSTTEDLASLWQRTLAIDRATDVDGTHAETTDTGTTHAEKNCSVMLVETLFPERLSPRRGEHRVLGQCECYLQLAERLLQQDNPEGARDQLRHVFGRLPVPMQTGYFATQVLILLKRCYRLLGESERADRCSSEARRCLSGRAPEARRRQPKKLLFSVIVPTYNRLPILQKCLQALENQTLAASDFEVIVIDDGSSDGTKELLSGYRPPFAVQYLRQANSGTGAARRNGVAHAGGEYLLLMNDDTICNPDLLEQHLLAQRKYAPLQWAVLGNFEYPAAARRRALTRYFCVEPFMFPQVSMEDGCPYGYSHFITCNLSILTEMVVKAGSFDSTYRLSEDTELGIRLYERGHRVLYHSAAHALHDHTSYRVSDLIRRARVYGADYFHMFRRHPRVVQEWAMPLTLTGTDAEDATVILRYLQDHGEEIKQAVDALDRWDSVDFDAFLTDHADIASAVISLFRQSVPAIHWFYLFESMLNILLQRLNWQRETVDNPIAQAALEFRRLSVE